MIHCSFYGQPDRTIDAAINPKAGIGSVRKRPMRAVVLSVGGGDNIKPNARIASVL